MRTSLFITNCFGPLNRREDKEENELENLLEACLRA